jgi:hypothetical protein
MTAATTIAANVSILPPIVIRLSACGVHPLVLAKRCLSPRTLRWPGRVSGQLRIGTVTTAAQTSANGPSLLMPVLPRLEVFDPGLRGA